MFDVNAIVDNEDTHTMDLFLVGGNQYQEELNQLLERDLCPSSEDLEESGPSRFMQDLSQAVADFNVSGIGQALQFVRTEDAKLIVSDLDIEETDDGLIFDPHSAEMILFDVTDIDGNSYKKVFHMLTEQVQVFYE